jgi:hypothetical protein
MRASEREMFYLVGTPRGPVAKYEKQMRPGAKVGLG